MVSPTLPPIMVKILILMTLLVLLLRMSLIPLCMMPSFPHSHLERCLGKAPLQACKGKAPDFTGKGPKCKGMAPKSAFKSKELNELKRASLNHLNGQVLELGAGRPLLLMGLWALILHPSCLVLTLPLPVALPCCLLQFFLRHVVEKNDQDHLVDVLLPKCSDQGGVSPPPFLILMLFLF